MKKRYGLILLGTLWMMAVSVFAKPIALEIDGKLVQTEVAPLMKEGTTLVPLRVITEELGALVEYNKESQMILVLKGSEQIVLKINHPQAVINNELVELSVAPQLIEGTTMVPIRLISENLDCQIQWQSDKGQVVVESKNNKLLRPVATIVLKDGKEIKAELYPATAPHTVANFISLANSGFYDGLTFHRVIENFMIQGGCPQGTGMGNPGYSIPGEFTSNGYVNTLAHTEGVLSMARSVDPNSAGSQFFIVTGEADYLDHQYAAFGKVILGMEYIYEIEQQDTDLQDKPIEPIVIKSIRVDTKGLTYMAPTNIQ